ncbi:RNA exonuclease 1 homolog [Diorhabda carinulata]|uniref:RNA exonuclease 1 homolog n=1 Tax=Diorhabda carinulata TaxID=1163345 RepID=UPI0025A04237|nr:RNA exonuclease 1 homolog [Diorhabda carinulata]
MLPTKGYFQDIECPYYNSSCGRPYCHFRHRKKQSEHVEEVVAASENETIPVVPTYKPTPKSQLANIQNIRSHIPISYVPDLAFRSDKKYRPTTKTENPTYKPTPLSILSSVNRNQSLQDGNKEHIEVINEIKQNIANVEYDPTVSFQPAQDINFEDLSSEFDLIDEIINCTGKTSNVNNTNKQKGSVNQKSTNDYRKDDSEKTKTDKSSNSITDVSKKKVDDSFTIEHNENDRKSTFKENVNNKESSHHQKNKEGKSPNHETNQKDKHKLKNKEKDSGKTNKDTKEHKDKDALETSKKSKTESTDVKHKSKEKEKSRSESKSKEEKSHSSNKQDEKDHHKAKTKGSSEKNSRNKSKDSSKKEKTVPKERSRSRSAERKKNKGTNDDSRSSSKEYKKNKSASKERSRSRSKERKKNKSASKERSRSRSKEPKKSKSTSKERSRSRSREHKKKKEKEASKERSRSRSKEGKHKKDKKRSKDKSPSVSKEQKNKKESDKKLKNSGKGEKGEKEKFKHSKSGENSKSSNNTKLDDFDLFENNTLDFDSDIELNEDETMLECYRIFNEYKPEEVKPHPQVSQEATPTINVENEYHGKKRIAHSNVDILFNVPKHTPVKPNIVQTPGQILANRYKLAKQMQANREQELLINEVQQTTVVKRPAPSLLEAARERKRMREMEKPKSTNLVDDILKGTKTITYTPTQKLMSKKITPVHNVLAITKAKAMIPKINPAKSIKTIAQTQKSGRVAHVPDVSLSDIPDVFNADKSKLPINVRTRFLTMIADECVKMYISKEEAYSRALKEEFSCYEKCKVLTSYRNSAMLAVNRLRKEIQERNKNGLGLIGIGEDEEGNTEESKVKQFYNQIKKWVLTEEELDIHGYPRQTNEFGVAIIKNFKSTFPSNLDENQRICSRCNKIYQVDDDGWPLFDEECCYHPLKKRTIRGEQTYLCCRTSDEMGCATSDTHVFDGYTSAKLEGFQTTMDSDIEGDPRSHSVYALDCEMCYTTKGLELTRVTIVDIECKTVYESLVKPLNPIIDYNTRFSGITKEQMDKTSTSILQVQANILHLCNSMTILVGHSLESDMKALKIVHGMIVDTSVLFPHKMGLPHKRALRVLASEYLRKIIQNDISGHDSAEDAVTCMELLKWKLKSDAKIKHS